MYVSVSEDNYSLLSLYKVEVDKWLEREKARGVEAGIIELR